jgi:hypothetical protein
MLRRAGVAALVVLLAWVLWYPMRGASAYLDDYVFLALGRHIATPWPLLVQDSTGAFFFRPLSMFVWALSVKAFGTSAPLHLALNMALHAANGALLYALLRTLALARGPAALGAILFTVHPTTFSAAAWLSDRFDLFSLFFGLASLVAIERFVVRPRGGTFAAACIAMLAALFSKEIGFGLVPAALAMLAVPRGDAAASSRQRAALAIGIAVCAALALAARTVVLRNVADTMFLHEGIVAALLGGFARWLRFLPGFIAVRHGSMAAMVAQWPLVLAVLAALAFPAARAALLSRPSLRVLLVGALIVAGAVGAQSPVVNASSIVAYVPEAFHFEPLAESRFYYVAFAGLAVIAAAIAQSLVPVVARAPALRMTSCVIGIAAIAGMLAASRTIGREWSAFIDSRDAPLLRTAVATVMAQREAPPGCKIYLIDMPERANALLAMLDVAVKQALPEGDPHLACFVQGEHAPWYNLLEARSLPPNANLPLEVILFNGKPYPPLRVANLEYFYLKSTNAAALMADPKATFYAFDGTAFRDVTREVRNGSRIVKFYDNRPPI